MQQASEARAAAGMHEILVLLAPLSLPLLAPPPPPPSLLTPAAYPNPQLSVCMCVRAASQ